MAEQESEGGEVGSPAATAGAAARTLQLEAQAEGSELEVGERVEVLPTQVVARKAAARWKPVTREQWKKLVDAFRRVPGSADRASKAAGVSKNAAEKAWTTGLSYADWPSGKVPIQRLLVAEEDTARSVVESQWRAGAATRLKEQIEADARAAKQASEAKVDEALMLQFGRKTTRNLLAIEVAMLPGLKKLAEAIERSLGVYAHEGKILTPKEMEQAMALIQRHATVLRHLTTASETLIESERTHLGQPGKRNVHVLMTAEEARAEIEAAKRAMKMMEAGSSADDDILEVMPVRFNEGEDDPPAPALPAVSKPDFTERFRMEQQLLAGKPAPVKK